MRKLILSASLLALAAPAFAQQPPLPPSVSMPPLQARPLPADAAPGPVAPMPAQPAGGFATQAPVGAGDTAQRMNLDGAGAYTREIQQNAQRTLDQMTKAATGNSGGPVRLEGAPITNQEDLEALTQDQREIVRLKQQVEKAKLAVELWGVVYNNEHAKAAREDEKKAKAEKEKAEKEKAEKEAAAAAAAAANPFAALGAARGNLPGGMPAGISAMPSAPPQVVEVNGGTARLLVPGSGEVPARAGTRLPNGMRVISVAANGVIVEGPQGRQTLGFGSMLSAPSIPQGMQGPPSVVADPRRMAPRI